MTTSASDERQGLRRPRLWVSLAAVAAVLIAGSAFGVAYWSWRRPDQRFARALAALDQGRLEDVRRELAALDGVAGYEPHGHFLRGAILLHARRFYPALDEFGRSVDDPELRVRTLTLSAQALYGLKQYQDTVRLAAQAVAEDPDAVDAHRLLGSACYDLGLTDRAIQHLSRVAELAPLDARPLRLIGLMLKDFEKYAAAIEAYRESLRRDPLGRHRQQVLLELAECQTRLIQHEEALQTLADAEPSPERWVLEAQCHYAAGRIGEAQRLVDHALAQQPAHLAGLMLQGTLALDQKKPAAAVDALLRAVTAFPKDHVARFKLVTAYQRAGDAEKARQQAQIAEQLKQLRIEFSQLHAKAAAEPGNADVRCRIGVLARELDRPDLARVWFEAALALDPRHAEARRNLRGEAGKGIPP